MPLLGETSLRFFQVKPLEAMATKTLAMMDRPTCADLLHLEDGVNYVEIGLHDFQKKIRYYLKHDGEREAIAERGYETFIKYHSSTQRAKQIYEELKTLC
jgi:spore maturation protein CgeB